MKKLLFMISICLLISGSFAQKEKKSAASSEKDSGDYETPKKGSERKTPTQTTSAKRISTATMKTVATSTMKSNLESNSAAAAYTFGNLVLGAILANYI